MNADFGARVVAEESAALAKLAEMIAAGPEPFVETVNRLEQATGRVILLGVGKSGIIARKIAATMASTGTPAQYIHPTDAAHGDMGNMVAGDVLVVLSKSGASDELKPIFAHARRLALPLIAITADLDSPLAQSADIVLPIPALPEAGSPHGAPTTSTIAMELMARKGLAADEFGVLHPAGALGAALNNRRA
jgi:arabinose-5-phosphate isomerase